MKKLIIGLMLMMSSVAMAQPVANPNNGFGWIQPAINVETAQFYTYRYYLDNSSAGIIFSGVQCGLVNNVIQCGVRIPPGISVGIHSIQITASNSAGEGPKSASFSFNFQTATIPGAPNTIRIVTIP